MCAEKVTCQAKQRIFCESVSWLNSYSLQACQHFLVRFVSWALVFGPPSFSHCHGKLIAVTVWEDSINDEVPNCIPPSPEVTSPTESKLNRIIYYHQLFLPCWIIPFLLVGHLFLCLVGNHIKINEVSNWYALARLAKRKPELSEPQEKSSLADALWWAAEYGHACIVERLFHYNVDLNLVGEVGSLGASWGVGHENGAVPRAGFLPLTSSYRV